MWTVDETATNTAVRILIREADSKETDVGKAAAISAISEIPSSTASTTCSAGRSACACWPSGAADGSCRTCTRSPHPAGAGSYTRKCASS